MSPGSPVSFAPPADVHRRAPLIMAMHPELSEARKMRDQARGRCRTEPMRDWYKKTTTPRQGQPLEDISVLYERAVIFWGDYERVLRKVNPDDPVYTVTRAGTAPATTADFWGYQASVAGQCFLLESVCQGEGTATVVNRWAVQRTTGLVAGGAAITPEKVNSFSAAAVGTAASGGTTALTGQALLYHAYNAFSGSDRWLPAPGEELEWHSGGNLVCRPASGAGTASGYIFVQEA
jgi:hypothetical protein